MTHVVIHIVLLLCRCILGDGTESWGAGQASGDDDGDDDGDGDNNGDDNAAGDDDDGGDDDGDTMTFVP